jgi:uncharacterized CHY-type Zn-finger protein
VAKLIGRYIDFNPKNVGKPTKSSSANTQSVVEGENTIVTISVSDKTKSHDSTRITGNLVDFKIKQQAKWTWIEEKPLFCMICKLPFKPQQEIARCPMCQSLFHRDHIFEWLKVKGKCPVCQQQLRPGGTEAVKL